MLCKCKMILMKGNILQRAKNKTATLLREKSMSSYFLSMNPRKWINHVSANLVVVLRRFHSAAAAHGATRTHSLTEFGFWGFEERSGQEKKTEKQSGNKDWSVFPTAEWPTGTRCRFLPRCEPNWPSWSWSYPRVSTWISALSSLALAGLCRCPWREWRAQCSVVAEFLEVGVQVKHAWSCGWDAGLESAAVALSAASSLKMTKHTYLIRPLKHLILPI